MDYQLGDGIMKATGYMAIDQHGMTYHIGNNPPRKYLLNLFGRKHADKMYHDAENGKTRHIGYVIAGYWLEIFCVGIWKQAI